ncbi:DgyrCDS4835 [Dimorphilus gyrociliatus]|uniref:DgyrCDS4835 n=1 Tax=Dimorphilus gyrociliatus TaxID=2664684 RepID=A0A7I8VIM8_9ANNE|nr:DgyrCDS4835 [Dimorphilus gyrociliatus]
MAESNESCDNGDKSFKSAIILMPPETEWTQIQNIREKHDKAYNRWMPHINLIWPFVPDMDCNFDLEFVKISQALSKLAPFKVKFTQKSFSFFEHKQCVLWLNPLENDHDDNPHPSVIKLQKILQNLYPNYYDGTKEFVPHLTLGRFQRKHINNVRENFQKDWKDIEFEVNKIYLISRKGFEDPFEIKKEISFN